ncbi:MAG: DUF1080 domain-containing protein, partial [Chlorobi bacterium]|nr:DUF1080 domain-containing protein [Chlorobiota bacterium]
MRKQNILIISLFILLSALNSTAQDVRTVDTKVADILSLMPAENLPLNNKLMREMERLGTEGLKIICLQIIPPGTGDDTKSRFAVESFSRYLSVSKNTDVVKKWEEICIYMIEKNTDNDVKSFFMQQLGYIGEEATLNALSKYLTDDKLYDPAIRAMYMVSPQKASAIFNSKLNKANGRPLIGLINAIGNSGEARFADDVARLFESGSSDIKKAVISAMPKLTAPASLDLLKKEAEASGYTHDDLNSTENLLKYADNIKEKDPRMCLKITKSVLKKSKTDLYGIDARLIMADCLGGVKGNEVLIAGMKNKNKKYRGAMIEKAAHMNVTTAPWLKLLERTKDPEVQKEVLYLFARIKNPSISEKILPYINNDNAEVRAEALKAFIVLNHKDGFSAVIDFMKKHSGEKDLQTASDALRVTLGPENYKSLIDVFNELSPGMKAVALNAFGLRRVKDSFSIMLESTNSSDENVVKAAYANLKNTAGDSNIDVLLKKFEKCNNPEYKKNLGEAIVAVVKKSKNKKIENKVLEFAKKSDPKDYIEIYAGLGGRKAAQAVYDLYMNSDKETKANALKALMTWSDDNSLRALFDICSKDSPKTDKEMAFKAYVKQVSSGSMPDDQKLLLLRKVMPYANSTGDKKLVIKNLGNVKTFLTYVYLKQFLDDKNLQVVVANSLFRVILPSNGEDNGLKGKDVKETLEKVKELISGPDSQYFKIDIENYINSMGDEEGFVSMFNGNDLTGWKGFVANPIKIKELSPYKLMKLQAEADKQMHKNWKVKDGIIVFNGEGKNLCTERNDYGDFEMIVDWKITKNGDSGIYLRGTPQVQIWDTSRVDVGAQVGSGGLYNNKKHSNTPLLVADNPVGDWNTFRIRIKGDKVTVYLNGKLVVDNVVMENYWNRNVPLFSKGTIELEANGSRVSFRNIYIKELIPDSHNQLSDIEKKEGFVRLFNGVTLEGWIGDKNGYVVENGMLVVKPGGPGNGFIYADKQYEDFNLRFEFKLEEASNNGIGFHVPDILDPHPTYSGNELQILDNLADVYKHLKPYQYHGSLYGVLAAKRGFLKPVGEWNTEEVIIKGT